MPAPPYGYCPHCEHRRELVPTEAGVLACHACDALDVYESKQAYEDAQAALDRLRDEDE